jgi:hypothetical protein
MATSQIEEYNVLGGNLSNLLAQYKSANQQAQSNQITTDILGAEGLQKLSDAYKKGKTAVEKLPESVNKLGDEIQKIPERVEEIGEKGMEIVERGKDILVEKGKEFLGESIEKGKELLSSGKDTVANMISKTKSSSADIMTLAKDRAVKEGDKIINRVSSIQRVRPWDNPQKIGSKMMERSFNTDPEVEHTPLNAFSNMREGLSVNDLKSAGEDFSEDMKLKLGKGLNTVKNEGSSLAEEGLTAAKSTAEKASSDILSAVAGVVEPIAGVAEAIGLAASIFGMKAPTMPNVSIPVLQVL